MTKVKELKVEDNKTQRILGGDIETTSFEDLAKNFDELKDSLNSKTYEVSLSQESIAFLTMELLPQVEWVGQQAWDVLESQRLISELKPDTPTGFKQENIRAIFQLLATNKYVGVDNVHKVCNMLTTFAEIIQKEVSADEQLLRDAGFELQAAEMGILPEAAAQQAIESQQAAQQNQ